MKITTPAFENTGKIPSKYTCDGENVNPELRFLDVPWQAKSLTLICHDPDAPREGGWTHWLIFNMQSTTSGIGENRTPSSGIQALTDFGKPGYGGPCPPNGTHRYYFCLYALDTLLDLDNSAHKKEVETAMQGHILQKAELLGLYTKQ